MRVYSNEVPENISLEYKIPQKGMVQIRLRENIQKLPEGDMYMYDEYAMLLPDRIGLEEEISRNFSQWLLTARSMELCGRESVVADLQDALEVLYQGVTQ